MFTGNLAEPFLFNRNCLAEFSLKIYLQKSNGCFLSLQLLWLLLIRRMCLVFVFFSSSFSPLEFIAIDLFGGLIV